MTTITRTMLIAGTAALFALTGAVSAVEAAKPDKNGRNQHQDGGERNHGAGMKYQRQGNDHRGHNRSRYMGAGWRGVYITGDGGSCSYAYRKWRVTGSRYWRSRYNDCRNG